MKGSALKRRRWGATVCAVYRVLEKVKYMCEESGSGGVELIPAENVVMTCILFFYFKMEAYYGETIESLIKL